ncbi:MAG: sigma-70 family RNA polymerase sigma factor [Myxococcota bacterium]
MEAASSSRFPWARLIRELRAFLRARVRDEALAEDILQSSLLKAHRHLQNGALPESPRAWLHQIARNTLIDSSRAEKSRRGLSEAYAVEATEDPPAHDWVSLEEADASALAAQIIPLFVARLPEPYRQALELTELGGLSQAEAAAREGVGLSAMKSRVQRGRRQLREELERCCAFELDVRGRVQSAQPHEAGSCPAICRSEACDRGDDAAIVEG